MRINKENALRIWEENYGNAEYATDFHGNLMCKAGYGNEEFYAYYCYRKVYCGWNIHHILPKGSGGTNAKSNLICTNIYTNKMAADKITFWIGDTLYQVQRVSGTREHEIVVLRKEKSENQSQTMWEWPRLMTYNYPFG